MRVFQVVIWLLYATYSLASHGETKNWAVSLGVGNSVGIGTFVTGYSQTPFWTTSLILNPSYKLPVFWGMPRITLSANQIVDFLWLDSYRTTANNRDNRVSFWDLDLNASMPKILNFESTGFSLGSSLGISLPASSFSRNVNRIFGISTSIPISWSKWGFSAGYKPSALVWIHSQNNIQVPCMNMSPAMINPYNSNTDIEQFLQGLSISKSEDEKLGDGNCIVSGRQNIWTLTNSFSLGWSNPNHAINLSLMWFLNFLRPLSDKSGLKSDYASNHDFNEATLGKVAYSYTVPIETKLVISAGILSIQASYDKSGRLTFPFFDFVTPSNNQTQIFLQATVGI